MTAAGHAAIGNAFGVGGQLGAKTGPGLRVVYLGRSGYFGARLGLLGLTAGIDRLLLLLLGGTRLAH